ncbi:hypothetical protein B0T19DRAFT_1899 [Cercophora scortea]|uniref:Fork-head domain-containing protein n=1 Tax=Cercophora scortea TaxID=314031 RepID=A0AAE0J1G4_9PEZI|nr:hypothetical protein B0T19DRAFT_1899 [Cercophora scortea]
MDPELTSDLSSAVTPTTAAEPSQSCTTQSPPEASDPMGVEPVYTLSPQQTTGPASDTTAAAVMISSSATSNRDHHFDMNMTGTLQGPCESGQASYMPAHAQEEPLWNACLRAQTGGDDFEHYTFNRASTTNLPRDSISGQSSPRSWTSPERFRPVPWDEDLPEPYLQNHYPRQDMQAAGLQRRHGECFFQGNPSMLSPPYPPTGPAYLQTQSFDGSDGSILLRTQPEPGFQPHHYSPLPLSAGGLPAMIDPGSYPLSPCSSTLGLKMDDEMLSTTPTSDPGDVFVCNSNGQYHRMGPSVLRSSPPSPVPSAPDVSGCSPGNLANSKNEEPYARLIYRAFMSTAPSYSMTLQEIYQWFRDNTDKGRSDSKGWQNSIRHNLSMNRAFTKSERKSATADDAEEMGATRTSVPDATSAEAAGAASPEPCPPASPDATETTTAADNKKSTKWYLEPWAINAGVQSTTRYRKGNQSRHHGRSASSRGGSSSGSAARSSKDSCATSRAMASSSSVGRRGTISTSRFKHPRPAPLRSAGPMHQMHHRFQLPHRPHHMHTNGLHMNDLSAYNPFMNGGGGGGGGGGMATRPAGPAHLVDFADYTDPQLVFTSNGTPSPHQHMMRRADSEHSVDEPVTPEQSFAPPPMGEAGLLLPDLRSSGGVAGPSNSSGGSGGDPFYSSTAGHHHHNHHHHSGIDLSNYTLHDGGGVGVYDPDRYSWAAAAAGVDGASAAYQQHY